MRAGPRSICLYSPVGLRFDIFIELVLWKRLFADDHIFFGEPHNHKLRYNQYTELGGGRSCKYRYHAGDVHVYVREWFDEHEPNGHDYLHADSDQPRRLRHVHTHPDRKRGKQANNQHLHGQPYKYLFGFQQHAELGDDGSDEYFHHAGNIHVHFGEWFDEHEPDGNHDLYADCE